MTDIPESVIASVATVQETITELEEKIRQASERFDHVLKEARDWKQRAKDAETKIEALQATIDNQRTELGAAKAENVTLRQKQAQPIAQETNVMEHDLAVYRLSYEKDRLNVKLDIATRSAQRWRIAFENVTTGLQYVIRWERPLLAKQAPVPKKAVKVDPIQLDQEIYGKTANPAIIEKHRDEMAAALSEGAA